jgi:hypothetical protein
VDWKEIIIGIPGILAPFLTGSKLPMAIGPAAKRAALFDRYAKEIAVRDALLKLKLFASEPNSPQQASAKEETYKQAEQIEAHLKEELARGASRTLSEEWWQHASLKEKFFPACYEGQKHLDTSARTNWGKYMALWYAYLLVYLFFLLLAVISYYQGFVSHKWPTSNLWLLYCVVWGFLFLYLAAWCRRSAYTISKAAIPNPCNS